MDINTLPSELTTHILSFVTKKETLDRICLVSKGWKNSLYSSKPNYYFKRSVTYENFIEIMKSLNSSIGDVMVRIKLPYLKENDWNNILNEKNITFPNVSAISIVHCDLNDDQLIKLISFFPNVHFFEYSIYYDPNTNTEPTKVTSKSFESLVNTHNWGHTNFRSLNICHSSLSFNMFRSFERTFSSLQQLSLTHTYFLENEAWALLFGSLRHLSYLTLAFSTMEDAAFNEIFKNQVLCNSIHDLRMIALHYLSQSVFKKFDAFKNLRALEVSLMNKFVNDDVREIGNKVPNLLRFRSQNYQATGEDAFKHMKNLEELSVPDTERLTDKAIKEISESLIHLQHLDIQNDTKLTQNAVDSLANHLNSLAYLDVRFCTGMKSLSIPKKMKKEGKFKVVQKNDDRYPKGEFSNCVCTLKKCRYFERDNLKLLYSELV